jgi:hypothetical protein
MYPSEMLPRVGAQVQPRLADQVRKVAAEEGRSVAALIRALLEAHVADAERDPAVQVPSVAR